MEKIELIITKQVERINKLMEALKDRGQDYRKSNSFEYHVAKLHGMVEIYKVSGGVKQFEMFEFD